MPQELIPKPTEKEGRRLQTKGVLKNTDAKHIISANRIIKCKRILHHDQMEFPPGIMLVQYSNINVIYLYSIGFLKTSHVIISGCAGETASDKMQHPVCDGKCIWN